VASIVRLAIVNELVARLDEQVDGLRAACDELRQLLDESAPPSAKRMITRLGYDDLKAGRRVWVTPHLPDCSWIIGASGGRHPTEFVEVEVANLPAEYPICGTRGS
jgi:hypothetical protein